MRMNRKPRGAFSRITDCKLSNLFWVLRPVRGDSHNTRIAELI